MSPLQRLYHLATADAWARASTLVLAAMAAGALWVCVTAPAGMWSGVALQLAFPVLVGAGVGLVTYFISYKWKLAVVVGAAGFALPLLMKLIPVSPL